ncbi:hypothetical protein HY419_02040 [candidate division WWE3 bacterium]|nr:hypothetical protein [candidate division WWE3 bacterium]
MLIDRSSAVWTYLDPHLKGLVGDGEELLEDVRKHEKSITDYSYLVFPFSKAYEGFLKRLFLDLHLIDKGQFYGDEIRIGRILNPSFRHEKSSVYGRINHLQNADISEHLWTVWKNARNLVFHYYPHNFRKLSYREAENLINDIVEAMTEAVTLVEPSEILSTA